MVSGYSLSCFLMVVYLQVYVPGVLACSSHVEKGDIVAVSVAVEQPGTDGGWGVGITRGTVLQGQQTGKSPAFVCLYSSDLM